MNLTNLITIENLYRLAKSPYVREIKLRATEELPYSTLDFDSLIAFLDNTPSKKFYHTLAEGTLYLEPYYDEESVEVCKRKGICFPVGDDFKVRRPYQEQEDGSEDFAKTIGGLLDFMKTPYVMNDEHINYYLVFTPSKPDGTPADWDSIGDYVVYFRTTKEQVHKFLVERTEDLPLHWILDDGADIIIHAFGII